ncbi:dGTPase [Myxococcus xanthus]|uniref:dGTPase n=1 Tax=Myxococcus xanthus TaxID=34 RepID=UPI0011296A1D|nr:dGTPase [Myxococcus xanthus]QDE97964.1 hypothetical protein BHS05_20165 [Myxococcus xanthus]
MAKKLSYETLISPKRLRPSEIPNRSLATETDSDHGRVLFSTAWRRLQQKAQVFPLEDNAAVRSRLTHSMEVSYIGRLIALEVLETAQQKNLSSSWGLVGREIPFRNIVETACLTHDIGNPPFGHFGEHAIREWFQKHATNALRESIRGIKAAQIAIFRGKLLPDFTTFDGNAQGLRILTKLQWNIDEFGLNLTHSQIAAFLKYVRPPYVEAKANRPFEKKPGFFFSEEPIVREVWSVLGLKQGQRYPLAYIMEAADDIAYCLSDIEDAIEKGLTDEERFRNALEEIWQAEANKAQLSDAKFLPEILSAAWGSGAKSRAKGVRFFKFKTDFTRRLTTKAAELYVDNHYQILNGTALSLLELSKPHKAALDSLKAYARRNIFTTTDAEHLELAGFQVVKSLLEHLRPLLVLPADKFAAMVDGEKLSGFDLERRLFNLLPKKHLLAYKEAVHGRYRPAKIPPALVEWFARAHLMVDFISGMTDRYALETYQLLSGIKV